MDDTEGGLITLESRINPRRGDSMAALSDPFLDILAEAVIQDHLESAGPCGRHAFRGGASRTLRHSDRRDGSMVPLHENYRQRAQVLCFNCVLGIGVAPAIGVEPLERNGGLDRTRICDLLRVKQAL
jgi:hypothetical protein